MSKTYTKKDLARIVAKRTGIPTKTIIKFITVILFSIADLITMMEDGDKLQIKNFGSFKAFYYFPKPGKVFKNPLTGEKVYGKAHRKVRWYPSKYIKERLEKL